jgi:hypothetical protein
MGMFTEELKRHVSAIPMTSASMEIEGVVRHFVAKPLTAQDMVSIKRAHPDFGMNPSLEGMIDLIILKTRSADDETTKVFDKADKPFLMLFGMDAIGQLFGDLFGSQMRANDSEETVAEKK